MFPPKSLSARKHPNHNHRVEHDPAAHPVPMDKEFEKWITADGLRFPDRSSVVRTGVRIAVAKSLDEVRINKGLKLEDLSAKPPENKPVFRPATR